METAKLAAVPVISEGHARGLRRQMAHDAAQKLARSLIAMRRTHGKFGPIDHVKSIGGYCGEHRRPPQPGLPGGYDTVELSPHPMSGEFQFIHVQLDRRRWPLPDSKSKDRLLLHVSRHATESLFQRLRTTDDDALRSELRPVGSWLLHNLPSIGLASDGYLLSPSGVFALRSGEPFCSDDLNGKYHWIATTWIADRGLADNTDRKERIANAVQRARAEGLVVGLVKV